MFNKKSRRRLRIGTRPSPLALKQVVEVQQRLPSLCLDPVLIETRGDQDKRTPLTHEEGSDFFTAQIESALLEERIDAAVHSAKDVETLMPSGLMLAVMTASLSPYECCVSRSGLPLTELSPKAMVGTSSLRRKAGVLRLKADLVVKDIRGNIDERLDQLAAGSYDAIIVAHAALLRLGYQGRITEIFSQDAFEPHPLQGRLSVQILKKRHDLLELFEVLGER